MPVKLAAAVALLALQATPETGGAGESVTLTAHVSSASGTPLGTVTFYDGGTALDTQPAGGGTVSIATTALAAGKHRLVAGSVPVSPVFAPSVSPVFDYVVAPTRRRAARR